MQYSGSSFSEFWATLFPGTPCGCAGSRGSSRGRISLPIDFQDAIGDGLVAPWFGRMAARLLRFRRLQPGFLSIYILYVLLTLLAVFLWLLLRGRLLG